MSEVNMKFIMKDGEYRATVRDGLVTFTADCPQEDVKLASGHNPGQLTEGTVGLREGWRLLSEEEMDAEVDKDLVEFWDNHQQDWSRCVRVLGESMYKVNTYRTQMPEGYFSDTLQVHRRDVLSDLKQLDRAISFGHPHEVIESIIFKYENLGS